MEDDCGVKGEGGSRTLLRIPGETAGQGPKQKPPCPAEPHITGQAADLVAVLYTKYQVCILFLFVCVS